MNTVAGAGWLLAGALVVGGGFTLWHLLFGGSVGGDVWLGQPSAWIDDQSGGPDASGHPASPATSIAIVADATLSVTTHAPDTVVANAVVPNTLVVVIPGAQASVAQPGNAVAPPAGTVPSGASPVTVTTTVGLGAGSPSSPSSSPSTSTPSSNPGTTDESATTTIDDSPSTTIDDSPSTTIDDGDDGDDGDAGDDGDGNSGRGGGDDRDAAPRGP